MIFVDTAPWFATFVPNDAHHKAAGEWLAGNVEPLVTTDYILDELLTLLRMRRESARALRLGEAILGEETAHLVWVLPEDVRAAWTAFRRYENIGCSFTDCVSLVVMRRLGIRTVFTFDRHFRQFGLVSVVP